MDYEELEKLLDNLDENQLQAVLGITTRIATSGAQKLSGELGFKIQLNHGGIVGNVQVSMNDSIVISKKRRVRSAGLRR